jgi:import inner membrane translocase subunit TIM16
MGAAAAGNATTGNNVTDGLTRLHRMTLDEARLILNLKEATQAEKEEMIKVRSHLRCDN